MCLITARHDCMRVRGVREPDSATTTETYDGLLFDHDIAFVQLHQKRCS
jgi:GTP cyclohydrolase IA